MTFENLPKNWTALPLTSPALAADVVDLLLSCADRALSSLLFLPCSADGIGYPRPVIIGGMDWRCAAVERHRTLRSLGQSGAASAVLAISAPRRLPLGLVRSWHTAAHDELAAEGMRLLGFCSADPDTVRIHSPADARRAA
ncbi:hypothetical protein BRM1_01715 [Brevibacterium sp. BRM-1]|uniref:hypothetical protein n=1 Tax=Brevibacterium sp. BRM-1 TaxID=2999062 RepID=UPI00227E418F|nr:hypothetical protein [Brevibacterium sp. BRM-1]WAL40619.1 hypothetical protein BRM1_01715 [Brevibacterium sp. BRM-1]